MFCITYILFLHIFQYVYIGVLGGRYKSFCFVDHKWNQTVRKCIPCEHGYFGINCETRCPFPYYGFKCLLVCNCMDTDCDHISGCGTASGACRQGHHGRNCEEKCPFPFYGSKCLSKCDCSDKDCHYVHGCRLSSIVSLDVTTNGLPYTYTSSSHRSESLISSTKHGPLRGLMKTNIDVPKKSTIPTGGRVSSVLEAIINTPKAIFPGFHLMLLRRCSYKGRGQIEIFNKNNFNKPEMEGECRQSISSSFYPGFFLHF
nr:uncharacterized protein LOC105322118 [Crassostrea gigas]